MADRFGYGEIGLDINPCRGCDDYDAPDGCKSNGGCGKPITNADRIRTMSDEELTEYILKREIRIVDKLSQLQGFTFQFDAEKGKKDMLDWLKQEVDDE